MKSVVGTSVRRREVPEKVSGRTAYIDDIPLPGALFGVTLRSSVPRGRIKALSFDPAFPWKECVVVTARDIPGENIVTLIEKDQPLLADEKVMHPYEPIAVIGHPVRERAYEALKHVVVEMEEEEPILSMEQSLEKKILIYGTDNVFKKYEIIKGDIEKGFALADFVVEGEYRVGHQEQAYIENNGMTAWVEKDGTIVVRGSLQCPYYVHKALKPIFGLPGEKVRVIQAPTGGGFGGKEEYPNLIAGHAALLALKAKRPVKMIYDRTEDMTATTKRHPALVRHRTGLTKKGKLVAQDIEIVMDGGAYATLSAVVLSRGTLHAAGPYECPHVRVRSRVVATNTPPNGAFRGFGAPQTLFAAELHMERLAQASGFDSLALRRLNALRLGSVTATGQVLKESVGALEVLEKAVKLSGYEAKRRSHARWNRVRGRPVWKGIGLAMAHHGAGFTGSGEVYLKSRAAVTIDPGGRFQVLAGSTEIGQGTITVFTQICAQALGVPVSRVSVHDPDTAVVPDSGPTVASRTTMVVGGLVKRASGEVRDAARAALGKDPVSESDWARAGALLCGDQPRRRFEVEYQRPPEIVWDDATYQGDAYGAYSYACCVVDLEVDRTTFEVRVCGVATAQEIGTVVNPLLAEGQVIGGTAQGLGYALLENAIYKKGGMINGQFTNYVIPTSMDTPPMKVALVEKPYSRGPFGAKGVGELPLDVPGPAVASAVHHACGAWVPDLPVLPEKILRALPEKAR